MGRGRVIFHIDMNCFFAAVEMAYDESLRGKPIAVAGNPEERRGIIMTSSYEARAYGVKTTMPVWQAKKLCPHLTIVKPNRDRYRAASEALFNLLYTYTPFVQKVSIDEGYLDVTSYLGNIHPVTLAKKIQSHIAAELKLPCSIGIAPNKFLAKMASDMKKPNGITVLRKREIEKRLWPLPIEKMHGIGRRTVDKWKRIGIETIGDLARADEALIREKFGERGVQLRQYANGIDDRPVDPDAHKKFKSIGQSTTLKTDTRSEPIIWKTFDELAKKIERRLKKKDIFAYGVQITIRYANWKLKTRSKKVENPLQSKEELIEVAKQLFLNEWNGEAIRLLGITTYDFVERRYAYKQLDLFSYKDEQQRVELERVVEHLQNKFGEAIIRWKGNG